MAEVRIKILQASDEKLMRTQRCAITLVDAKAGAAWTIPQRLAALELARFLGITVLKPQGPADDKKA